MICQNTPMIKHSLGRSPRQSFMSHQSFRPERFLSLYVQRSFTRSGRNVTRSGKTEMKMAMNGPPGQRFHGQKARLPQQISRHLRPDQIRCRDLRAHPPIPRLIQIPVEP